VLESNRFIQFPIFWKVSKSNNGIKFTGDGIWFPNPLVMLIGKDVLVSYRDVNLQRQADVLLRWEQDGRYR
jgi:hypothetical protein